LPDEAQTVAPIYARLLAIDGRDDEAALRMAGRAAQFRPDPEFEALAVRSLLNLHREGEAIQRLETALTRFCAIPGHPLAQVAAEVLRDSSLSVPGWVGINRSLDFIWQLSSGEDADSLRIEGASGALSTRTARLLVAGGQRLFCWRPPEEARDESFYFRVSGVELLGSGRSARPDFALDGRGGGAGRSIRGWASIGWAPANPLRLRIADQEGHRAHMTTQTGPPSPEHWPFALNLHDAGLGGSRFEISAQLPDGRWQPLPDTPLLLEGAVRLPALARNTAYRKKSGRLSARHLSRVTLRPTNMTDVIIPVYGAREETLACLKSVLATIGTTARAVVIDDATDDTALASALDELAAVGRIQLLRNVSNQGFVASVNRALACDTTRDAVLLNSDTLVFGDWLERLRAAAYSGRTVGTVTPFTNNGAIASYPLNGSDRVQPDVAAAWHALAASVNSGATAQIPVGVGCCLYLRRDCLLDVGALDEAVFGRGYGEETDFCLRARMRGWSHRLAADVFVFHAGGRSFRGQRAALMDRSQRLLNIRYPGYDDCISRFVDADSIGPLRRRMDERRLASFDGRFVLVLTLALTGGVDRFVAERCRDFGRQGLFPLVLRPIAGAKPGRFELWTDALPVPDLRYEACVDLAAVRQLLRSLRVERVEIQHFLDLDPKLVEVALSLGPPYDVYLHDYVWICPRVTLIDGTGRYCREPALAACETCIRKNGSRLEDSLSVAALRRRSARWLQGARAVYAPSSDAALRYQRYFPGLPIRVRAHGPMLSAEAPPPSAAPDSIIRVALIGALGEHKGYRVLLDCARDAKKRRLPLDFVVIGYTEDDRRLLKTSKVFVTGRYTEGEAPYLIGRERPHLAFMPSVWPETWCYALDHVVRAGLPVVAFDLGAIAERLRAAGLGILLSLDSKPSEINDRFLEIATLKTTWQTTGGSQIMINPKVANEDALKQALGASVQILPLPVGLYLFSVRAATPSRAAAASNLTLPAIHVGLGPGVHADEVEFVAGPSTDGAWLFAPGDLLVVRVTGAGTTLVLTSIRAPGGEILSIKVERLEDRIEGGTASAAAGNSNVGSAAASGEMVPNSPTGVNVPLQINAHIRARGDRAFTDAPWAGRLEPGLWIESFSVKPLEAFGARDIEYKGLTASGFETPWLSDGLPCGTKGMALALIGFAVRLKASAKAAAYICEYSGYFQSGTVTGPFRNGAPCRSTIANDPLEGLQIRILGRTASSIAEKPANSPAVAADTPLQPVPAGPAFGKYRDGGQGVASPSVPTSFSGAAGGATSRATPKSVNRPPRGTTPKVVRAQSARESAKSSKRSAGTTGGVRPPASKLGRRRP
jgi:GT2 family glycosyltransferase/glycosyltransferase involved in cell wall biosynthesis